VTTTLSRESWQAIRRIEITTGRLVSELFAGRYLSTFKGRGMEFLEVREYTPGDDPRLIDWNVTARLGHLYIKRHAEERELTLLIVLDVSRSLDFGSGAKTKSQISAELTALLSFAALRNNDKVGMIMFSDTVEKIVPPRKSRLHALRLIRDVLEYPSTGVGTNLSEALRVVNRVARRRAIVFVISDFISQGYEKILATTHLHHDTIPIVLTDPREEQLPDCGLIQLEDAETGKLRLIDTADPKHRAHYREQNRQRRKLLEQLFGRIGIDSVFLKTNESFVPPLIRLFETRARKFR
jgi:uncharacterized protein (DUF58 family)